MKKIDSDNMPEEIKKALEIVPGIQYAFIYNSSVKDLENHDETEIIVLGSPDLAEMDDAISGAEEKTGRPLLTTSFTVTEFRERIRVKDEAALRTLQGPKRMLLGNEEEMRTTLDAEL